MFYIVLGDDSMSKELPHIEQNMSSFPKDNTRVYPQYNNQFDYSKYIGNYTIFKPCNVRWNANDNNRVYWQTDAERDAWFDSIKTPFYTQEYTSGMNIVDGEEIKLPIPYQAIQQYNYLMVIVPNTPVDNNVNPVKRFYYHIINATYMAPSVSMVTLELDYFTTYQHSIEIARIALQRGHYAMALTNASDFLADPMTNNAGLLTPESDAPDMGAIVSTADFYSLGADDLCVCFAMRCSAVAMRRWGRANPQTADSTPPVYGDASGYWGDEYNVAGYRWATDGDYSAVNNPTTPNIANGNNRPNGYEIIGALTVDILNPTGNGNILEYCQKYYPQFFSAVEAMFIVPKTLITFNTNNAVTLGNYTLYTVNAATDTVTNITLDKSMFDYPNEYADIAKLYTTPYAAVKLTDTNTNNVAVFNIQDMSNNVTIERRCSIAYPYLNAQMFLRGIGSNKTINYQWRAMNNANRNTAIPESAYNFIFNYDIPTFELMVDNTVLYYLSNYNNVANIQREQALNAYHNAIRSGNTSAYNTGVSAETSRDNTARNIANTRANTVLSNNNASANNTASNNTMQTNVTYLNTELMVYANELNTKDNNFVVQYTNPALEADTVVANHAIDLQMRADQASTNVSLGSAVANMITGAASGAMMGGAVGSAPGAVIGGIVGAVGGGVATYSESKGGGMNQTATLAGGISGASSTIGTTMTLIGGNSINQGHADAMKQANTVSLDWHKAYNISMVAEKNDYRSIGIEKDNDVRKTTTNNNITLANTITANNIALNTNTTNNTCNTTAANNTATYNTTIANNNRNKETNIGIAKRQLELKQRINDWAKSDMNRSRSATIAQHTGNAVNDIYGSNGILMQIVTQPNDIIKRCGDSFLQYGYAYNQNVENPNLIVNEYFSYWQGDALIYSINAPNNAIEYIRQLFATGLTVWASGDTIGHSIYDNNIL